MKAVVLHEYGGPDRLKYEEWDDPQAGDGQILIRVAAAGVNPIDWKIRSGAMKAFMPLELPAILGYDYSGVVHSVGKGVEGYAEGDEVFGRAGKCYAEFLLADLAGLSKLPKGLDPIEAAALPVVLNTGEQLIVEAGKVQAGQSVVITGALGSVGRTAVWVAKKLVRTSSRGSAVPRRRRQRSSGPTWCWRSMTARRWIRWAWSRWSRIRLADMSATRLWLSGKAGRNFRLRGGASTKCQTLPGREGGGVRLAS